MATIVVEQAIIKITVLQLLELIKQLTPDEREAVRQALTEADRVAPTTLKEEGVPYVATEAPLVEDKEDWRTGLGKLIESLKEKDLLRAENPDALPELTDEEIQAEVDVVRQEMYAERQQRKLQSGD